MRYSKYKYTVAIQPLLKIQQWKYVGIAESKRDKRQPMYLPEFEYPLISYSAGEAV
jgi:hypothetical protein